VSTRIYHPNDKDLFQRKPDGNFYIWLKGTDHCLETNDFKQAQAAKEYHKALATVYGVSAFKATFGKVFPQYEVFLDSQVRAKARRESYVESIKWYWTKYLRTYWAPRKLVEFNQITWDEYCKRTKRKFEVSDFTNHRSTLTSFLSWARARNLILAWPEVKNPAHKSRKRKIIPSEHLTLIFGGVPTLSDWHKLSKVEKKKLIGKGRVVIPGGLRLFMAFYLFEGMRRKEITDLTFDRVDLEQMHIILGDEDVKTNEGREIPLNNFVANLLRERIKFMEEMGIRSKFVFPNARDLKRPMSESGFKLTWHKLIEKVGLKRAGYTWHDFRATFEKAMNMSKDFTDMQKEKMAGSSLKVQSKRYVSMNANDLRGLEEVVKFQISTGSTPDEK
jgi:integrase